MRTHILSVQGAPSFLKFPRLCTERTHALTVLALRRRARTTMERRFRNALLHGLRIHDKGKHMAAREVPLLPIKHPT